MRTLELMPLMTEKGVHFDFCTFTEDKGPLDDRVRQYGGKVFCVKYKKPDFITFGKRFIEFLKQSDYDIIHTHSHYFSGYLVYLAYKAGIKSRIVHFRITTDAAKPTLLRKLYGKVMLKMIDKHATSILAVCKGAMEHSWGHDWLNDSRCCVIYNGLDLSGYKRTGKKKEEVLEELGIPADSKLIINVGRFLPQKAHEVLIKSAAMMLKQQPGFHFLLVGIGPLLEEMQTKVAQLRISQNVHFLGLRDDVPRLLKASDCFVLSSHFEGLPGVVLEAMAAELPIVATDLPGVREIAEHTNLIKIVPVQNSEAICKNVLEVFNNQQAFSQIYNPFPAEFDLQNCANNLYEVYIEQLNKYVNNTVVE
ncbi:MAG: hypothetical protein A2173_11995 [Planctomycetes bacterium RBG_13_44_8b]|nr:MAG: hypothetical protein A2173_11995 [Planctomycetes bacterium RBG_13_44_8b]